MTTQTPVSVFFMPVGFFPLADCPDNVSHDQNQVDHDPDREKTERGTIRIGGGRRDGGLGLRNCFLVQDFNGVN